MRTVILLIMYFFCLNLSSVAADPVTDFYKTLNPTAECDHSIIEKSAEQCIFVGLTGKKTKPFKLDSQMSYVNYSFKGSGNFIVQVVELASGKSELLVNAIGKIEGNTWFYKKGVFYLDITANGVFAVGFVRNIRPQKKTK